MDGQRFDALTKGIAGRVSRRGFLRAGAGVLAAAAGSRLNGAHGRVGKIPICHANDNPTTPYVVIAVPERAYEVHLAHSDNRTSTAAPATSAPTPMTPVAAAAYPGRVGARRAPALQAKPVRSATGAAARFSAAVPRGTRSSMTGGASSTTAPRTTGAPLIRPSAAVRAPRSTSSCLAAAAVPPAPPTTIALRWAAPAPRPKRARGSARISGARSCPTRTARPPSSATAPTTTASTRTASTGGVE
jgi:hypothetical protein